MGKKKENVKGGGDKDSRQVSGKKKNLHRAVLAGVLKYIRDQERGLWVGGAALYEQTQVNRISFLC